MSPVKSSPPTNQQPVTTLKVYYVKFAYLATDDREENVLAIISHRCGLATATAIFSQMA